MQFVDLGRDRPIQRQLIVAQQARVRVQLHADRQFSGWHQLRGTQDGACVLTYRAQEFSL